MSTAATPADPRATWPQFWLGARLFLPLAVSIAAYGVVWGVLAGQKGMSVLEVALMSGLVFAGASQFVALDMWVPDALPVASIVMATAIVNLRMLLMTATLKPLTAGLSRPRALAAMFAVSDEQWALTMSEVHKGGGSISFLMGTALMAWGSWMISTVTGRLVGSIIESPESLGLDFAFVATFIALLLGMWKGRADLLPWAVAAVTAILAARLLGGNWYILIGGLAGSFAGALAETLRKRRHVA